VLDRGNGEGCFSHSLSAARPVFVSSYSVRSVVCPGSFRERR
jgi:hypothetical protein